MLKYVYWILSTGSLGLLALEAPTGQVLTSTPARGKVTQDKTRPGGPTVRRGPTFIWLGGGYHGGK